VIDICLMESSASGVLKLTRNGGGSRRDDPIGGPGDKSGPAGRIVTVQPGTLVTLLTDDMGDTF
jgi:hypothetical protein